MIKIIEHGHKEFVTVCPNCGCKYSYEISDIVESSTICPECGTSVSNSYRESKNDIVDHKCNECEFLGTRNRDSFSNLDIYYCMLRNKNISNQQNCCQYFILNQ